MTRRKIIWGEHLIDKERSNPEEGRKKDEKRTNGSSEKKYHPRYWQDAE